MLLICFFRSHSLSSGESFMIDEEVIVNAKCFGINIIYSGADGAASNTTDRKKYFSQEDHSLDENPLWIRITEMLKKYDQMHLLNVTRKDPITNLPSYKNGDWAHIFKILVNKMVDRHADLRTKVDETWYSMNMFKLVYEGILTKYQGMRDNRAIAFFQSHFTTQHFDKTSNDCMNVGNCIAVLGMSDSLGSLSFVLVSKLKRNDLCVCIRELRIE